MPKGAYAEVIKGPARRLEGTKRALKIEEPLVDALLADIEAGGAKDALPLLAFTLERLYVEQGGDGDLRLPSMRSSAASRARSRRRLSARLKAADADPEDSARPRRASCSAAARPYPLARRHRSRDREPAPPRRAAVGNSRRKPSADRSPGRAASARNRCCQRTPARSPSSRCTRRCSANGGCCKAGSKRMPACSRAGKRQTRLARLGRQRRDAAWLTHSGERLKAAERLADRPDLAATGTDGPGLSRRMPRG